MSSLHISHSRLIFQQLCEQYKKEEVRERLKNLEGVHTECHEEEVEKKVTEDKIMMCER